MTNRLISTVLIISIVSIGSTYVKLYPVFFTVFCILCVLNCIELQKNILITSLALMSAVLFATLINVNQAFDLTAFSKFFVNIVFFIFCASYCQHISRREVIGIFSFSAFIFLSLSFMQAVFLVAVESLWNLPFRQGDSSVYYFIQDAGRIYFGDQNKNIWASKVAIFLIISLFCGYSSRVFKVQYLLSLIFGAFCLVYVSSRTAQLAVLAFLAGLFFYHIWVVKRWRILSIALAMLTLYAVVYVASFLMRVNYADIFSVLTEQKVQNHGDGLLARIIIWKYIFMNVNLMDYISGNGVLSFPFYTGGTFYENNPHNVFLNILLDFGLVAFVLYFILLWLVFRGGGGKFVMMGPFVVIASSQYLGYDAELLIFFAFVMAIGSKNFLKYPMREQEIHGG